MRPFLLVVHHRDSDRTNNSDSNLETLCFNCHITRHLVLREGIIKIDFKFLTDITLSELVKWSGCR